MATNLAKHYARLRTLWPKDPLRPTLPFTHAIEHAGAPYGVKPLPPTTSTSTPATTSHSPSASTSTPKLTPAQESTRLTALYSLLENRYSTRYPLSEGVLRPASAPTHYTDLMREIERAPGKGWWQAKWERWRGMVRWQ